MQAAAERSSARVTAVEREIVASGFLAIQIQKAKNEIDQRRRLLSEARYSVEERQMECPRFGDLMTARAQIEQRGMEPYGQSTRSGKRLENVGSGFPILHQKP